VTRKQLLALGLGRRAIGHRVAAGRLIREYTGVYAVGHVPVSFIDWAAAAVLACGPGAVLSRASAASLWGIRKEWRRPFEVTVPTARRRRGITVHRSRTLTRNDIRTQLGIRVTSPARTLLDYAPTLNDKQLTRAVNDLPVLGYEVDALFPEHRVIVELDGYGYHSSKDSFESDRERDAATLAAGLQTVRITSERMNTTPAREAKRLHTILEARI